MFAGHSAGEPALPHNSEPKVLDRYNKSWIVPKEAVWVRRMYYLEVSTLYQHVTGLPDMYPR